MTVVKDITGQIIRPKGIECKISDLKSGEKFFLDISPYSVRTFICVYDGYIKTKRECGWLDREYNFNRIVYKFI